MVESQYMAVRYTQYSIQHPIGVWPNNMAIRIQRKKHRDRRNQNVTTIMDVRVV